MEVKPVADDEAAATRGLDVGPVPIAVVFGNGDERFVHGTRPMETVAAERNSQFVRFGPILWLTTPNTEQPDGDARIGGRVEIVEFARRLQILPVRVKRVGA